MGSKINQNQGSDQNDDQIKNQGSDININPDYLDMIIDILIDDQKKLSDKKLSDKKLSKKDITILFLDKDQGSSLDDIAKGYRDLYHDPDMDKNKRIARLWISKIGFKIDHRYDPQSGIKYYFRSKDNK